MALGLPTGRKATSVLAEGDDPGEALAPLPPDAPGGGPATGAKAADRAVPASWRIRDDFLADSLGWALAAAAAVLLGAVGLGGYFLLSHRETVAAPLPALSAEAAGWLSGDSEVAVYKDGKVYLYGAAANEAEREAMVRLASDVIGPQNVVSDEYHVDPRQPARQGLATMRVADSVLFETDSSDISASFDPVVSFVADLLAANPRLHITVVGHTDDVGSEQTNIDLSQARALAVARALIGRGADPARLVAEGRGESQPIADNGNPAGQRLNRRVEFLLRGF